MRSGHEKSRVPLPSVWLMTDERVKKTALLAAARRLPRGSGIVLRHHATEKGKRRALLRKLRIATRGRNIVILLAGKPEKAVRWGADGWHGRPPQNLRRSAPTPGKLLHSASAHDIVELRAAWRSGAHLIFLSPLFATRSHPGAASLGAYRFAALARLSSIPVMALGGVQPRHARLVRQLGASGYGAIDGLVRR